MMDVSIIVAHKPAGQSKWNHTKVYFDYGCHIDEPMLFLLIRTGEVEEAIRYNTFYWNIDDLVSRSYTFYSPNRAEPLTRQQLRIMAARMGCDKIYWITPRGQLLESRQRLTKLYFEKNAEGRYELRSFEIVINGRIHYKKLAVLTKQQERELMPEIKQNLGFKLRYSQYLELGELLVAKGIIKLNDMFDIFPVQRVRKDTQFTISYNENYLKKPRRKGILPEPENLSQINNKQIAQNIDTLPGIDDAEKQDAGLRHALKANY